MSIKRVPARQAGLTMIELIVFVVVIAAVVGGIIGPMASISARAADPLQRKQAMLRAESLLEEVALAKFTYCHPSDANAETATSSAACATAGLREGFGPQAGETRPYFNINDYVTASGVEKSFHPTDASGNTTLDAAGVQMLPAGYKAMVSITPVSGFGPAGLQIGAVAGAVTTADTEVLRIRVTVSYGDNQQVVLDRYRTRYAPTSMP